MRLLTKLLLGAACAGDVSPGSMAAPGTSLARDKFLPKLGRLSRRLFSVRNVGLTRRLGHRVSRAVRPSSTVTSIAQVSGQSCGQAARMTFCRSDVLAILAVLPFDYSVSGGALRRQHARRRRRVPVSYAAGLKASIQNVPKILARTWELAERRGPVMPSFLISRVFTEFVE
jgi:hypothetical protein